MILLLNLTTGFHHGEVSCCENSDFSTATSHPVSKSKIAAIGPAFKATLLNGTNAVKPQMAIPIAINKSAPDSGKTLVGANCSKDPGESDLISPETKTVKTTPIVDKIPPNETKERKFKVKKEGGVSTKNARILKWKTGIEGKIAFNESENKTTNETPLANKSKDNNTETKTRPLMPNGSTSDRWTQSSWIKDFIVVFCEERSGDSRIMLDGFERLGSVERAGKSGKRVHTTEGTDRVVQYRVGSVTHGIAVAIWTMDRNRVDF
ncbi:hypothetical protein WICPIJ_005369 [Wickerhamomyces pijperi]|uniref:Uncharacterized protein n=1 Tax=Wickerhamomyces pijperi TaxID=599730 RepID=A0A9P8Q5W8_WICPI|nr:hypothetical protein WICPIJ_005369 [Wickerhamomyces pijperi]